MRVAIIQDDIVFEILEGLPDTVSEVVTPLQRERRLDPLNPEPPMPGAPPERIEGEPEEEFLARAQAYEEAALALLNWRPSWIEVETPATYAERPATAADWFPDHAGRVVQLSPRQKPEIGDRYVDGRFLKPGAAGG